MPSNKSKKTGKPLVEVIVLIAKGEENIPGCLNSLKKSTYPNLKVTVVDQNSKDKAPEIVKEKYPWVNLVHNKVNNGFAGGNNQILRKSKAKYCIMLNDDTEQKPSFITELVNLAEKNKDVAIIQPKILSLREKGKFEYAGAAGGFMDIYGYPTYRGNVFDNAEKDIGQYNDNKELFWGCGSCLMLNMALVKPLGFLDEDLFAYAEELDLCWRVQLAGKKILFCSNAVVYHLGSGTFGKTPSLVYKKHFYLHRNLWTIYIKNQSLGTLVKRLPIRLALELLNFKAHILKNSVRAKAVLFGLLAALGSLPCTIRKRRKTQKLRKVSDKEIDKKLIKTSIALRCFLLLEKKEFSSFTKYIKNY